jgi:spermidine/putrescine transport system permease protein
MDVKVTKTSIIADHIGKIVSPGFGFALLCITYLPILLIILFSFNKSVVPNFPMEGFTFEWYRTLFLDGSIMQSFKNTVFIALLSVAGSVLIGISSALLLHRYKFRINNLYQILILMPFILPGIFTGISLLLFFSSINLPRSLFTVFIGHVVLCTAVVFKNVLARLQMISKSQEEASYDLGASSWQTFIYVTLPNIRTALITGALLAFVLSFDETLITFFVIGPQLTLPLKIWAMMRAKFSPKVHALASLVFLSSTVLVIVFSKYILPRAPERS